MFNNENEFLKHLTEHEYQFVTFQHSDLFGKLKSITYSVQNLNIKKIAAEGIWINEKTILKPDWQQCYHNPFSAQQTMLVLTSMELDGISIDCPRSILRSANKYFNEQSNSKISASLDLDFFLFDSVRYNTADNNLSFQVDCYEAPWTSNDKIERGNWGHRCNKHDNNLLTGPNDGHFDIRSEILSTLTELKIPVIKHLHATENMQQSISLDYSDIDLLSDYYQISKYVIKMIAHSYGKTATFMPKPLANCRGSNLKLRHKIISKEYNANNLLTGLTKHNNSLRFFTNPTTNSYKNKFFNKEDYCIKDNTLSLLYPDSAANIYLTNSAILMSYIDGLHDQPYPKNHSLSCCASLGEAIYSLEQNPEFLVINNIFTISILNKLIERKKSEEQLVSTAVHPYEFDLYYDC